MGSASAKQCVWGARSRPRGPSDRHTANISFGGLTHIMARAGPGTGRSRLRPRRIAKCLRFMTYDSSGLGTRAIAASRFAPGRHIAKGNPLAV
jgi:hypothetical protein